MSESVLVRNGVRVLGNGEQVIMFAPGFGFEQSIWAWITPSFEQDYKLITFDYVGFGQSNPLAYDPEKYSNLEGYAEDVIEIITSLGLEDVLYVGHSVGAMIGLLASIDRPDLFKKLVLIGPSPCYFNLSTEYQGGFDHSSLDALMELMEKNYINWTENVAATIINDPTRMDATTNIEERFSVNDPKIMRQFAEAIFFSDYRHVLSKVTVPSFIIQCDQDAFVPPFVANYMNEHLPSSTLHFSNTIGHCPHLSHPEKTVSLLQEGLGIQFADTGGKS